MCVEMVLPLVAQGVTRCLAGLEYCVRGRDRAWGGSVATSHTGAVFDSRLSITRELMYETYQKPYK